MQGKAARNPFPSTPRNTTAVGDRLSCDVLDAGTDAPAYADGFRYVSVVLDNHTGAAVVSLLKNKSDTSAHVQQAVAFFETQSKGQVKVKALRFDRGGEYSSTEFKAWCAQRGIVLEPTAPYSPQQDGKAERYNRTLVEKARVMLLAAGLDPRQYWRYAVVYANWLRNRSPYSPTGITPYEGLMGEKPDISKAHVFGGRVVYKVPEQRQGFKFEPTGMPGRFLGLDGGGYIILKEGGGTVVSRDVKFLEQADVPSPMFDGVVDVSGSTAAQPPAASGSAQSEQLNSGSSSVVEEAPPVVAERLPIKRVTFVPEVVEAGSSNPPAVAEAAPEPEVRRSGRARKPRYDPNEWVVGGAGGTQANVATGYSFRGW